MESSKLTLVISFVILTIVTVTLQNAYAQNMVTMNFTLADGEKNTFTDVMEYQVEDFQMAGPAAMCPSGNCTYELNDGEFSENMFDYAWVLKGTLMVKSQLANGDIESNNYDLGGSMKRVKTVESSDGSVTETIDGDVNIDREEAAINFNPEYEIPMLGTVKPADSSGNAAIKGAYTPRLTSQRDVPPIMFIIGAATTPYVNTNVDEIVGISDGSIYKIRF